MSRIRPRNFVARPRITRPRISVFAAFFLLSAQAASACATCFGDPDSGQTVALNWAMGAMLGVTAAVMLGIGAFAYGVYRRGAVEGAASETAHE